MKIQHLILSLGLALGMSTSLARADAVEKAAHDTKDARLVPLASNGLIVGLKVYAIRPGGRFDQPEAKFKPGDVIETIDGVAVTSDPGSAALDDKLIHGTADTVVGIRRDGAVMHLTSKAVGHRAPPQRP